MDFDLPVIVDTRKQRKDEKRDVALAKLVTNLIEQRPSSKVCILLLIQIVDLQIMFISSGSHKMRS